MAPENSSDELKDLITITRDAVTKNLQAIVRHDIPVWRKNIDGVMVTIPMDKLERYIGEHVEEFTFYMNKNWESGIKEARPAASPSGRVHIKEIEKYADLAGQAALFRKMSVVEREEVLDLGIEKISNVRDSKTSLDLSAIIDMVEVVSNTFHAHHADLEDLTESMNLRKNIVGIIGKTRWMLRILIEVLRMGLYHYKDFNIIEEITTKSPTFDHITRVLLKFVVFCIYFNSYIDQGLVTKKIRAAFRDNYVRFYKGALDVETISIETVFKDGIRRIDEEQELVDYAMGALLFDMGKLPDLSYHDSSERYDERIVKKHVLNSYNMISKSKVYPFVVPAMAIFHHELYGSKAGYRLTDPVITKLFQTTRDGSRMKYFITYNEKEFINGQALSFFPVKVLEVVDIFDALKNKKKKTVFETLMTMKKEFIINGLKIDPVLFSIFVEFNAACGLIDIRDLGELESLVS